MATLTNEELLALLPEFKRRLDIPTDETTQEEKLKEDIVDAYEFCAEWCNDSFRDELGVLILPGPIKRGMALMIQIDESSVGREGIASESVGGMSQTFIVSSDERVKYANVFGLWRKNKKLKFVTVTNPYTGYQR